MARHTAILVATTVAMLATAPLVAAASGRVSISDRTGDVVYSGPGYMDITRVDVTGKADTFTFKTTLAQAIPAAPPLPPPCMNHVAWVWGMDIDPTTDPQGFPGTRTTAIAAEIGLRVVWDGTTFRGELVDRRPLLRGEEVRLVPQPFVISSNEISMTVQADAVGNPATFLFDAVIMCWSGNEDGNLGWVSVDFLEPFWNPWPASPA